MSSVDLVNDSLVSYNARNTNRVNTLSPIKSVTQMNRYSTDGDIFGRSSTYENITMKHIPSSKYNDGRSSKAIKIIQTLNRV